MTTAALQRLRHILCAAPFAALLLLSIPAHAEPPSRVGRLSFVQGDVSFFMDRDDGWRRAQLNFPVTSENSLWTENGGRAEVRIGASVLRIDDRSLLDFVRVQDDQTQTFLQRGTLNLRLRDDDSADQFGRRDEGDTVRVETSEGQFVFSRNGRYRIDSFPENNQSRVSVYVGRAHFESRDGGDTRINVEAGKSLVVRSTRDSTDFHFKSAAESPFDRWKEARDQNWNQVHIRYVQERAVSPYMTGYEDLDQYGDWSNDREYGRLWTPRLLVNDWAPYRYGRWANVQPWGWTWVDDSAWGFAPFHYGRWVQVHSRWAWWPGPYVRHPVYAPALVAWFNRPGVSISISSGPSVGWCPLAPREYYLPGYSNNATYIRNINYVTNNITIINPPARYANQLPGATVVSNNVFLGGRSISRNIAPVPPAVIAAQTPGTGVDFGPRFTRQESGNGQRDRRGDERQPQPTFAPSALLPPVLPAQRGRPGQVPAGVATPQYNKPTPMRSVSSGLSLANSQSASQPQRVMSSPVARETANQPTPIEDSPRVNPPRPRLASAVIERAPIQPVPAVANYPNERSMGDRVAPLARLPQNAGEQRYALRPLSAPEHEGRTKPVAAPKPRSVPAAIEPKGEGRSKP